MSNSPPAPLTATACGVPARAGMRTERLAGSGVPGSSWPSRITRVAGWSYSGQRETWSAAKLTALCAATQAGDSKPNASTSSRVKLIRAGYAGGWRVEQEDVRISNSPQGYHKDEALGDL